MNKPVAWLHKDGSFIANDPRVEVIDPELTPLYTHPVKQLFNDSEDRDILIDQEFETYVEVLTGEFKDGFREGVLFCEDVANRPALYGQKTHPVKQLSDEEIMATLKNAGITEANLNDGNIPVEWIKDFARAIIKEITE